MCNLESRFLKKHERYFLYANPFVYPIDKNFKLYMILPPTGGGRDSRFRKAIVNRIVHNMACLIEYSSLVPLMNPKVRNILTKKEPYLSAHAASLAYLFLAGLHFFHHVDATICGARCVIAVVLSGCMHTFSATALAPTFQRREGP